LGQAVFVPLKTNQRKEQEFLNTTVINEPVDFATIKQSVPIERVLDHYGLIPHLRRSRDGYRGVCPIHGGHNPTQFSVSTSRNAWVCFGDCGNGGSVLDFVSCMEKVSLHEAAQLIQQWFSVQPPIAAIRHMGKDVPTPSTTSDDHRSLPNEPLCFTLSDLDATHPYLSSRGLVPETIATFGIGYCTKGTMAGRIAIPIHNLAEQLVAYAGRCTEKPLAGQPKYLFPRGFRKSLELFNYHRALMAEPLETLVVVEGFFDCMKVWQAGFQRVVAIMGSSLSGTQEDLILKAVGPHGEVLLMFDENEAGRTGREKAATRLARNVRVKIVELYEEGIQPDHLPACEIVALLADASRAVPA
jgi:DNA primase